MATDNDEEKSKKTAQGTKANCSRGAQSDEGREMIHSTDVSTGEGALTLIFFCFSLVYFGSLAWLLMLTPDTHSQNSFVKIKCGNRRVEAGKADDLWAVLHIQNRQKK